MKAKSEDRGSGTHSPNRIDPRAKLIAAAAISMTAAFSRFPQLGALALFCLVLQLASRIPPAPVLKRLLPALPLLVFLAITLLAFGGAERRTAVIAHTGIIGVRTILVLWCVGLFSATTAFTDLVRALRGFGVPRLVTDILFFASRYESLLLREAERMRRALHSRMGGNSRILKKPKVFVRLLSRPLERAFDRSGRIHAAMLARGYRGKLPVRCMNKFSPADIAFITTTAAWIILILRIL